MIALILTVIVPLLLLIYVIVSEWRDEGGWAIVWGLLGGFLAFLVGVLLTGATALIVGPNDYREQEVGLRALSNNSEVSGSFFLGSGTVDEEQVFRYIEEQDDGSFTLEEVEATQAKIVASDDPHLIVRTGISSYWWLAGDGLPLHKTYIFHIPDGSIANNYSVAP